MAKILVLLVRLVEIALVIAVGILLLIPKEYEINEDALNETQFVEIVGRFDPKDMICPKTSYVEEGKSKADPHNLAEIKKFLCLKSNITVKNKHFLDTVQCLIDFPTLPNNCFCLGSYWVLIAVLLSIGSAIGLVVDAVVIVNTSANNEISHTICSAFFALLEFAMWIIAMTLILNFVVLEWPFVYVFEHRSDHQYFVLPVTYIVALACGYVFASISLIETSYFCISISALAQQKQNSGSDTSAAPTIWLNIKESKNRSSSNRSDRSDRDKKSDSSVGERSSRERSKVRKSKVVAEQKSVAKKVVEQVAAKQVTEKNLCLKPAEKIICLKPAEKPKKKKSSEGKTAKI